MAATPVIGEYDVVVVGSGAAGMTAALTAAKRGLGCVVVEKAPTFGGSAARSGAGIWVPCNEIVLAAGQAACRTVAPSSRTSWTLRDDGTVIPRLYAAGNASAAVMGYSYAGAGATIGPAMTFGYIAANDIADAPPAAGQP